MVIAEQDGALLRQAQDEDWPRLDAVVIRCWEPIFAHYQAVLGEEAFEVARKTERGGWRAAKAAQVRSQYESRPEWFWVLERDGEPIGFITFVLQPDRSLGLIGNNGVDPEHAGHGYGTLMYRHVLAHFREAGLHFASVTTGLDPAHAPARRAYEAVGFDRQIPVVEYWQDLREERPGSAP